jgi:fatty-acid peroxygenase
VKRPRRTGRGGTPGTALATFSGQPDFDGTPLARDAAAVELLNVLRPIVAVARFVVFAALALLEHERWAATFAGGPDDDLEPFVQEVRRLAPFFPAIGARVVEPFDWRGHAFRTGDWFVLDIWGTNRDRRLWDEPLAFRPERFRSWAGDPNGFIPQGGGAFETDHRCPGEWLTIELTKEAVRFLTRRVRYEVPPQDLSVSLRQIPALPRSGLVLANLRPA